MGYEHKTRNKALTAFVEATNSHQGEIVMSVTDFFPENGGYCELKAEVKLFDNITVFIWEASIGDDEGPMILTGFFERDATDIEILYNFLSLVQTFENEHTIIVYKESNNGN